MPFDTEYLDGCYQRYLDTKYPDVKIQILYTIIEIKKNNPNLEYTNRSLYVDVKEWIHIYLKERIEKDYGYDSYDKNQVIDIICNNNFSERQKISLYYNARNELINRNDTSSWIDPLVLKEKLLIFKQENFLKYIIILSGKNKLSCICTLGILYFIECLILYPYDFLKHSMFSIKYIDYADCFTLNHMINVLALRLQWIDGPKLYCLNYQAVTLCFIWAVIYIVFVANILFKNLFDDIDINDL